MKIIYSPSKIYQSDPARRVNQTPGVRKQEDTQAVSGATAQKINIPKDFSEKLTLNREEQEFFQKLYPRAKKEIRQYMQNQNKAQADKGKFIDVRG